MGTRNKLNSPILYGEHIKGILPVFESSLNERTKDYLRKQCPDFVDVKSSAHLFSVHRLWQMRDRLTNNEEIFHGSRLVLADIERAIRLVDQHSADFIRFI
jgi:hypothetical protein